MLFYKYIFIERELHRFPPPSFLLPLPDTLLPILSCFPSSQANSLCLPSLLLLYTYIDMNMYL